MDDGTTQAKTSRPLPAANQKAAGFAAFRPGARRSKKSRASGSANASSSTMDPPADDIRLKPKPQEIGRTVKNNSPSKVHNRHDSDYEVNISRHPFVSEARGGKKRKLDEIEIIELEDDEGSIEVLNPKELSNMGTLNKACTLVRAALAKAVEGEKERLCLEASLHKKIAVLEDKLKQEKTDHDDSKRHIRDLERALLAAASSLELTNTLLQASSTQLIRNRQRWL